ncbi:hypothetical protein D3981_004361 [Escherichia coli]|nr:hypothetical protein [Escherichia coli]
MLKIIRRLLKPETHFNLQESNKHKLLVDEHGSANLNFANPEVAASMHNHMLRLRDSRSKTRGSATSRITSTAVKNNTGSTE